MDQIQNKYKKKNDFSPTFTTDTNANTDGMLARNVHWTRRGVFIRTGIRQNAGFC